MVTAALRAVPTDQVQLRAGFWRDRYDANTGAGNPAALRTARGARCRRQLPAPLRRERVAAPRPVVHRLRLVQVDGGGRVGRRRRSSTRSCPSCWLPRPPTATSTRTSTAHERFAQPRLVARALLHGPLHPGRGGTQACARSRRPARRGRAVRGSARSRVRPGPARRARSASRSSRWHSSSCIARRAPRVTSISRRSSATSCRGDSWDRLWGHAVCALYFASGLTDVAIETGDEERIDAVRRWWNDLATTSTYVTGAVGGRWTAEAVGEPYELPLARSYTETCGAVAAAQWHARMLRLDGDARAADALEQVFHNALLAGMSLEGDEWFYANPHATTCRGEEHPWIGEELPAQIAGPLPLRRAPWRDVTCCPPNVNRALATLPGELYGTDADGNLWIHMFASSHVRAGEFELDVDTDMPWSGRVTITVHAAPPREASLFVRVPAWSSAPFAGRYRRRAAGVERRRRRRTGSASRAASARRQSTRRVDARIRRDRAWPVRLLLRGNRQSRRRRPARSHVARRHDVRGGARPVGVGRGHHVAVCGNRRRTDAPVPAGGFAERSDERRDRRGDPVLRVGEPRPVPDDDLGESRPRLVTRRRTPSEPPRSSRTIAPCRTMPWVEGGTLTLEDRGGRPGRTTRCDRRRADSCADLRGRRSPAMAVIDRDRHRCGTGHEPVAAVPGVVGPRRRRADAGVLRRRWVGQRHDVAASSGASACGHSSGSRSRLSGAGRRRCSSRRCSAAAIRACSAAARGSRPSRCGSLRPTCRSRSGAAPSAERRRPPAGCTIGGCLVMAALDVMHFGLDGPSGRRGRPSTSRGSRPGSSARGGAIDGRAAIIRNGGSASRSSSAEPSSRGCSSRRAGYQASLIDYGSDGRSNTNPPTLYTAVVGLAQVGILMILARALDRLGARFRAFWDRAGTAAIAVYVWHLTALAICVAVASIPAIPTPLRLSPAWWWSRPLWYVAVLASCAVLVGGTAFARSRLRTRTQTSTTPPYVARGARWASSLPRPAAQSSGSTDRPACSAHCMPGATRRRLDAAPARVEVKVAFDERPSQERVRRARPQRRDRRATRSRLVGTSASVAVGDGGGCSARRGEPRWALA